MMIDGRGATKCMINVYNECRIYHNYVMYSRGIVCAFLEYSVILRFVNDYECE